MMRHSKSDIHLVYVQGQRESILKILDKMCEAIAGGLPEHVKMPKEESVSEKAAQTTKKFADRYGIDASKRLAQIDYTFPEETEKLEPDNHR